MSFHPVDCPSQYQCKLYGKLRCEAMLGLRITAVITFRTKFGRSLRRLVAARPLHNQWNAPPAILQFSRRCYSTIPDGPCSLTELSQRKFF